MDIGRSKIDRVRANWIYQISNKRRSDSQFVEHDIIYTESFAEEFKNLTRSENNFIGPSK